MVHVEVSAVLTALRLCAPFIERVGVLRSTAAEVLARVIVEQVDSGLIFSAECRERGICVPVALRDPTEKIGPPVAFEGDDMVRLLRGRRDAWCTLRTTDTTVDVEVDRGKYKLHGSRGTEVLPRRVFPARTGHLALDVDRLGAASRSAMHALHRNDGLFRFALLEMAKTPDPDPMAVLLVGSDRSSLALGTVVTDTAVPRKFSGLLPREALAFFSTLAGLPELADVAEMDPDGEVVDDAPPPKPVKANDGANLRDDTHRRVNLSFDERKSALLVDMWTKGATRRPLAWFALGDGSYPAWRNAVYPNRDANPLLVSAPASEWQAAMDCIRTVSKGNKGDASMVVHADHVTFSARSDRYGEVSVDMPCTVSGPLHDKPVLVGVVRMARAIAAFIQPDAPLEMRQEHRLGPIHFSSPADPSVDQWLMPLKD